MNIMLLISNWLIEYLILFAEVVVGLEEDEYSVVEAVTSVTFRVSKNTVRLANPITLLVAPYNISYANKTGVPLPSNVPPLDSRFNNHAKSKLYNNIHV